MICYHSTTRDRVDSIMENGLLPNSKPNYFSATTPYAMLGLKPWPDLNGEETVVLKVNDPAIKGEHFTDPEGLRWPNRIKPKHLQVIQDSLSAPVSTREE
ncbi:hypothetical protein LCGC14_2573710 [marine sediment metagenome]|uniref:Uncharacterized protein n=1 Tax=marine sediment metagenome TaxID=412755 RepID=A0A0F9AGG8_9ZZZZ